VLKIGAKNNKFSTQTVGLKSLSQVPIQEKIFPVGFIVIIFVISLFGLLALYSISGNSGNLKSQAIKFVAGFFTFLLIGLFSFRIWYRLAYFIFVIALFLLILVFIGGHEGGLGAVRWLNIFGVIIQPSEFVKVALILALARYFHDIPYGYRKSFMHLYIPGFLIMICVFLIFKQPNLGTAIITLTIGGAVMFFAGFGWKKFAFAVALIAFIAPFLWFHMHPYQQQRVLTFLDPSSDPLGSGYNVIQSQISIGSGGFFGKGYLEGSQNRLNFVPESKTDFIFTVIAEEFGFLGSIILICCFTYLIFCCYKGSLLAKNFFLKIICLGVATLIFLHVFINIGMVSGILPVVGVPLPLVSYGGSSLLSTLFALGLVLNAYIYADEVRV
jgi:rod shape determining protein RodA